MTNNESRRYKHDIKRQGDIAKRPVEMFKREYTDKTSLVLKSRNVPENEIFMEKNGIKSVNPIFIHTNVIPFQMSIDLDLSKSKYHYIKLEDNLFVNNIINFENGVEYRLYVSQDELGSHNLTFGNDINGLFKEFGLNLEPNTTTLIKITPINNVLYIEFDTNSRENPFYITSFTPLNNSENININQNTLTATFTKDIVFGVGDISIKRFSDDSIFQTFVVDNEVTDADLVISGNTLTINAQDLEYDEQYYIIISNGSIESFDGIPFAGISDKNTWTFKTAIPFVFTIDTTLGTGSSFDLPLRSGYNYDMLVDWGDGQTSEITSWDDVDKTHTYATGGEYQISITGLCEAWYFNNGGDKLKLTSINQWGDIGFVNMGGAFYGCSKLTTINDTNGTWCSNVTDMRNMFFNCNSLVTLDVSNWDVSNVTHMNGMFGGCSSLNTLDVSTWNVSNVTHMNSMFQSCTSLTTLDVSTWNVSNVTSMNAMFNRCTSLTALDVSNWNVSNVTNMNGMFTNTPLDTTSYDALLIGWSQLPSLQPNVNFNANLAKYQSLEASKARQHIIDTYGWTITDAGQTDAFEFTIDTTLGIGDSMLLPLREGYNYNMLVDWGDGQTSEITSWDDPEKNHTYVSGGTYNVSVRGVCEAWYSTTNEAHNAKFISINQWGNTSFINMNNAFQRCRNLQNINDTDGTWCKNVVDMNGMFNVCQSLTTLDVSNWDVSNVTDMNRMFQECSSLTTLDVSNWDVSNVTVFSNELVFDEITIVNSIFQNTPLDTASYDALLIGWSQLPSLQPDLRFSANLAQYSAGAAADARQYIINTYGWTIVDAGQVV